MTPLHVRLKVLREDAGLTQQVLADRSGVRQATISDLETGRAQRVAFSTIERLATALKVDPHELFKTVPPESSRTKSKR